MGVGKMPGFGMPKQGDKQSSFLGGLGAAAEGVGAVSGLLGMIGQKKREERQQKRQMELNNQQKQNQRELNEHGASLAMQMWRDTNYSAQMQEMRKAGLNPSLMYGGSGAGGTTASAGSGGSAAGGSAAMSQGMPEMMGIDNMLAMKRLANETKIAEGTKNKLDSEANLNKTRENEIKGIDYDTKQEGIELSKQQRAKIQKDMEKVGAEIRNMNANTDRTKQLADFEKYEQGQKELGVYPHDSAFWRQIMLNSSEEDRKQIADSIKNSVKLSSGILDKYGQGMKFIYNEIFKD